MTAGTESQRRNFTTKHINHQPRGESITPQHRTLKPTATRATAPQIQEPEETHHRQSGGLLDQVTAAASYQDRTSRDRRIRDVLAGFSKQERAALAGDDLCPTTVMRHLVLDRPVVQRSLADNPVFTSRVLGGVVSRFDWRRAIDQRHGGDSVRLVMHPDCPVELHGFHLEEFCWFDPVRWLLHPTLSADDFEMALVVGGPGLAKSLLRREEVLAGHLDLLINNSDAEIRSEVARTTNDSQVLVLLAADPDMQVRQAASQTLLDVL